MDATLFTENATGTLVRISYPYSDYSFIPSALPPEWELSVEDWQVLSDAKQVLGELNGIGRYLPNPELLLKPLQQREALRSSSLEGTYATPAQLLLFELEGERGRQRTGAANPWREVSNYGRALREGWAALTQGRPLSLFLIKELHAWLLEGVRGRDKRPGEWRMGQVCIGVDRRFVPPPHDRLQDCLIPFENAIQESPSSIDPLVYAYMAHYQFEAIHPFVDGNGRVGRLLLALMTARSCRLRLPWLYMSAYFERHKDEYIDRLFNVSARGEWAEWIRFCITGTIEQAQDTIRRCDLLVQLRNDMQQRVSSGSGRLHSIVEDLLVAPVLTIPMVRDRFGVTYPTAKSDVDRLIETGILRVIDRTSRPKAYYAPQIFRVAYEDLDQAY